MQNNLINELGTNFIEYAVAVNTDRAIPDAKSKYFFPLIS